MRYSVLVIVLVMLVFLAVANANNGKGKGNGNKSSGGGNSNKADDKCGNKPKDVCEKQKERKEKLDKRKKEAKDKFAKMKKGSQRDRDVGDSVLRVDKEGAKIEILREGQTFEIKMKEIKEKIQNITEPRKYNLRKTVFNVTKNGIDNTTYNVTAGVIVLTGRLDNGAVIRFFVYMFDKSANITGEDGNDYELVAGGTKANFELEWPNEVEHLEIKVAVKCGFEGDKGRKPQKIKSTRGGKGAGNSRSPETFSVCPNARMTFSPSYISNGTRKTMENNYPMPEDLSDEKEAVVSLKFNGVKKVFYDPTAEGGDDIGDDPLATTSAAFIAAKPNFYLTMVLTAVFALFKMLM